MADHGLGFCTSDGSLPLQIRRVLGADNVISLQKIRTLSSSLGVLADGAAGGSVTGMLEVGSAGPKQRIQMI